MKKQCSFEFAFYGLVWLICTILISCEQCETSTIPTILTNQITSICEASAICGGKISSIGSDSIIESGVCWSTSESPTISDKKTTYGATLGSFSNTLIGLSSSTTYYVRAYATNSVGTGYGNQVCFTTSETSGTVTDIDGNVYNTITIGDQVWMKENLRTTKYNDGTSIPNITDGETWKYLTTPGYCAYNNDATQIIMYGALYNWYTVNTGYLAPKGWHIPAEFEWERLKYYLITNGYNFDGKLSGNSIAKSLAATTDWYYSNFPSSVGCDLTTNNSSGFSGLPGGCRWSDGRFARIDYYGYWWNTSGYDNDWAWGRYLYYDYNEFISDYYSKKCGFSVRCIRDY